MPKKKRDEQRPKETFSLPVHIVETDPGEGIVEALVTTFGTYIEGHEAMLHPGSFKKTLNERGGQVRVLDNHNAWSVMDVIGRPLEIREVMRDDLPSEFLKKFPQASGALYTKTQFLMDTPEGFGAFTRIDNGAINEYSIGFDSTKEEWGDYKAEDGTESKIRNIREVRFWEYSPVIWGANKSKTLDTYALEVLDFDLRKRASEVEDAWYEQGRYDEWNVGVARVYDTHIILRVRTHPVLHFPFYQVEYTYEDETGLVTFADEADWTGGNFIFTPGEMAQDGPEEKTQSTAESQHLIDDEAEPDQAPLTSDREAVVNSLKKRAGVIEQYLATLDV